MIKKAFTVLLLAVVMLTQFSTASAVTVTGTTALAALPASSDDTDIALNWSVTGMAGGAAQNILVWARIQATPANVWGYCANAASVPSLVAAAGTYTFLFPALAADQDVWEFRVTVDNALCAGSVTVPATGSAAMGSTTIDTGTTALAALPAFSDDTDIDLNWSVTGMPGSANQNILVWARIQATPSNVWGYCANAASVPLVAAATGIYTFLFPDLAAIPDVWEFRVTVDNALCAGGAAVPSTDSAAMGSTTINTETIALVTLPAFSNATDVDLDWSVTGMAGGAAQNILVWARIQATPANVWGYCANAASVPLVVDAADTYTFVLPALAADQDVWEFRVTVDNVLCAGGATVPTTGSAAMGSTTIDDLIPSGFRANPPSLSSAAFAAQPVTCNTFEMWALASDNLGLTDTDAYSGMGTWNQFVSGTYTPPAPLGPTSDLLSWKYTFPATATREWSFSFSPSDKVGNEWAISYFRNALAIGPAELANCKDFSDTSGIDTEVYIRYLADLNLIAGNPDGTFRPDSTLTRAEASTLFEKANGFYDETALPTAPPSEACTFTDVLDTDWFARWVWQACKDGFMNGLGGGLFGPADLLTRGQIVTVLNNVDVIGGGITGTYLDNVCPPYCTVLNNLWGWRVREANWLDVAIGAFYAEPVQNSYGVGVADGTSATTFSPDVPVTRGEFAKMLYRALSRVP